jgi:murein DD-endopeptidase MepM/ murein hydrolase activator NlpD
VPAHGSSSDVSGTSGTCATGTDVRQDPAVRVRGARPPLTRLASLACVLAAVAVIGSACGQFPQARRSARVQVQAQPAAAAAKPTPAASQERSVPGRYAADGAVRAPRHPAITGGKSTVDFSKFFPRSTRRAGKAARRPSSSGSGSGTGTAGKRNGSSRGAGNGKTSGDGKTSGNGKTSGSGRKPGTGNSLKKQNGENPRNPGKQQVSGRIKQRRPPTSIPKLATLVSREMRRGAEYNSHILPPGFPFKICPVWGKYEYSDSYGAPRYAGGYHPHAGNDIIAARGTPIVAPFPGVAERVPNTLGGNAVEVHGSQGYVYNAHLVAYGEVGRVHAGDVVGFVGNTGDAQGGVTHDHIEWHPDHIQPYDRVIAGTNGAVDPFPYLQVVCPPD